jgi:hypothetical protein
VIVSPYSKGIHEYAKTKKLAITTFSERNNPHELDDKKTKELNNNLKQLIVGKTRGVSSKYLWHYSNWLLISQTEPNLPQLNSEIAKNTAAWTGYTGLELKYQQFFAHFSAEPYLRTSNREWKNKIIPIKD